MSYIINNKRLEAKVDDLYKVEWMDDWRSSQEHIHTQPAETQQEHKRTTKGNDWTGWLWLGGPWKQDI
jgi:hypothetical protein